MMHTRTLLAILVTGAFLLTPVANAQDVGIENPDQSTPTTLYMHFMDAFNAFPINTQPPHEGYVQSQPAGLTTSSQTCVEDPTPDGSAGLMSDEWHTYYGFSTPGYVQYDFQDSDGSPRTHPERGISFDVDLDTSSDFKVYWYLETQATASSTDGADLNEQPVVVPNVQVMATLREGDDVSVGAAAFNEGDIIAQGASEPITLEPNAPNHHLVDNKHVYEFEVPMEYQLDTITRDDSYNLRIDVMMENPLCDNTSDGYLMPNLVKVHTSPDLRPRMDLSVMNAIRIEYIHPQFVGDEMVIHTSFNSPWGNYDVDEDEGGITVDVTGPSPASSLTRAAFVQKHHEHGQHQEPVDVTYVWPYKNDDAERGEYGIEVSVWNDQRTAEATGFAKCFVGNFACDDDQGQKVQAEGVKSQEESPGIGLVALLAAVAVAVLVRRR